jgi:hypothetical protein
MLDRLVAASDNGEVGLASTRDDWGKAVSRWLAEIPNSGAA